MSFKRTILTLTATLGLLAVPFLAQAQPEPAGHRLERLARFLSLTDAQVASAQPLAETLKSRIEPLVDSARKQRQAIKEMLATANPDPAQVGRAVIAGHQTREQVKAAMEEFDRSFAALLTPEQKTRYEAMKALRFGHRGAGGKRGPGRAGR